MSESFRNLDSPNGLTMKTRLLLFCVALSSIINAQDYNQWSEHFGARASLLGGAASAGLGDNATVYYNAAAMTFVENPSMSISVNAYRVRNLKLTDALGDGINLKNTQFSTAPNLIAGIVELKKRKRLRLGYAVITRRSFSGKFDNLYQASYDILSTTVGEENFVASYNYQYQLSEYWAGFGISYRLSDSWSIGLAHYGIYRDVKNTIAHSTSVLPNDGSTGDVASVSTNITFNYWNVKGVFKPSIALSVENFKFGIVATLPSFNIMGKASIYRDYSIINLDELIGTDVTFIDRADGVKAIHKENGSLAIGVSWRLGKKAWLHFTNETFFGGKYYLLFNPEQSPSVYPTTIADSTTYRYFGDQNFLAYGEESEARTNIGIGLETKIAKRWDLYLGARTDFLFNERPYYDFRRVGVESSKWNLYHLSMGLVHLNKKNKKYTVGFEYGFSPKTPYYRVLDFKTPTVQNGLIGYGGFDASAKQFSFKLLLEIEIGGEKH